MARHRRLSDLPDFLQNSPFLPLGTAEEDDFNAVPKVQAKPSLRQILRSKRFRTILIFVFVFIGLITLPGRIKKLHPLVRLGITGPKCYFSEPVTTPTIPEGDIDWSQFAYTQYVTNTDYLCNSLMIFETLLRLGSQADRLLLYPSTLLNTNSREDSLVDYLLGKAKTEYNVKLIPIEEQHKSNVHRISPPPTTDIKPQLTKPRNLGLLLHQAPRLQPNPIHPPPAPRFRLNPPFPPRLPLLPTSRPHNPPPRVLASIP
jgi:hypothetical protein